MRSQRERHHHRRDVEMLDRKSASSRQGFRLMYRRLRQQPRRICITSRRIYPTSRRVPRSSRRVRLAYLRVCRRRRGVHRTPLRLRLTNRSSRFSSLRPRFPSLQIPNSLLSPHPPRFRDHRSEIHTPIMKTHAFPTGFSGGLLSPLPDPLLHRMVEREWLRPGRAGHRHSDPEIGLPALIRPNPEGFQTSLKWTPSKAFCVQSI